MTPSPERIRQALDKIVSSPDFVSAGRLSPFLAHLVNTALGGETDRLKESVLGVEFFERGTDYDPRLDPVVRIEARRLRLRLEKYYRAAGANDIVRIGLPKGGYVPSFDSSVPHSAPASNRRRFLAPAAALLFVCIGGLSLTWVRLWRTGNGAATDPARVAFERGVYQMNLFSDQGMRRAIGYFNESLGHDAKYAPSLAYLSQVYALMTYYNSLPEGIPTDKARALAESAIQADPELAEAHAAMGFVLAAQQYRWSDAEREFQTALQLNPRSGLTHGLYGLSVLAPQLRPETLGEFRRALELDPNSSFINFVYAFTLMATGDLNGAIKQYERTLELNNIHPDMLWDYGMALGYSGRHKEAREVYLAQAPDRPAGGGIGRTGSLFLGRPRALQAGSAGHREGSTGRHGRPIGSGAAGGDGGRNRVGVQMAGASHRRPGDPGDLAEGRSEAESAVVRPAFQGSGRPIGALRGQRTLIPYIGIQTADMPDLVN
ncbi:MAG TPA: tetratricopeptide repeat protein [Bryobacteraceae bacterium]|nr:tetratricopeptide repeat protein [Bryobacteraceae bacterium]